MKWYKQQTVSSTAFRLIEHHRSIEGPFFHEFLLLRLTDGLVCRVERVGEGSRPDAIRQTGCTANDLIQWLSAESYGQFLSKGGSKLIVQVDLERDYDILAILAICYAIQHTKSCQVYTLQRYNCYFFSCTILSIITRRVSSWGTAFTRDSWDKFLVTALGQVSCLTSEEGNRNIVPRTCALLDPTNPDASGFLIAPLQTCLDSRLGAHASSNAALGATLWYTEWSLALRDGLADQLETAAQHALNAESTAMSRFLSAIRASKAELRQMVPSYDSVCKVFIKQYTKDMWHCSRAVVNDYLKQRRAMELEHPITPWRGLLQTTIGSVLGVFGMVIAPCVVGGHPAAKEVASGFYFRLMAARFIRVIAVDAWIPKAHGGDRYQELISATAVAVQEQSLPLALNILGSNGPPDPLEVMAAFHQLVDERDFLRLLSELVTEMFHSTLPVVLARRGHMRVRTVDQTTNDLTDKHQNVTEFQDYIRNCIMTHARRVHDHQLGIADLIVQDIERTMTQVWRSMPSGFGSEVSLQPQLESKRSQPMYEIIAPSSNFGLPMLNVGTPASE